ncbi:MAG TPA: hypothetical protein DCM08_08165 [Microscillaceae bacterium]|jgi:long-subunit fatty acid transport protein|nr:hypothetical protein [Microscillaceae bacterium]
MKLYFGLKVWKRVRLPIFMLAFISQLQAQTNHYWSQQFGARSSLMAGAVVAGGKDNSVMYYNPALLVNITHPSISVTANAYKYDIITIKNGAGDGIDLNSERLSLFPQLISGMRSFKDHSKWRWGYSLMTRFQANIKTSIRKEFSGDVLVNRAGLDEYIGEFRYEASLNELWGGLTLAHKVSDKFSVGLTQYIAYRTQGHERANNRTTLPIIDPVPPSTTPGYRILKADDNELLTFTNFKAIWKLGFAFDFKRLKLGLTITSPSVNITGSANVQREILRDNLNLFLPGNAYRSLVGTGQQNVKSVEHKTPLSIGVGVEYHFPKTIISFVGEYFAPISNYFVIKPEPAAFIRPTTLTSDLSGLPNTFNFLAVSSLSREIFNFGFGLEQHLTSKIILNAGFRTDFDSYERSQSRANRENIVLGATYWDLYHVSAGFTLKQDKSEVTFGINYAFSSNNRKAEQQTNFSNPTDAQFLLGTINRTAFPVINSINVIVGFTQYLNLMRKKDIPANQKD